MCAGLQLQNKDSVLLNLLVNGEDASHGYLCQTLRYDRVRAPGNASDNLRMTRLYLISAL